MENPYIWKPEEYLHDDVGIVVSPFDLQFPNHKWMQHHPAVPWFYDWGLEATGLSHHQSARTSKCLGYLSNRSVPVKQAKFQWWPARRVLLLGIAGV